MGRAQGEAPVPRARVAGEGAGLELILVHGSGADCSHWPADLGSLGGCRVHFLDLPGHGASPGPGADRVEPYAEALAAYVEAHGLQRVVVAGHSMGGAVALTLALTAPRWLIALILVGSGSRLRVMPALLDRLETDHPGAVELILQALFGPAAPPAMVEAERQRYLATHWRLIRDDLLACDRFDVGARLGEIRLPTLVVTGGADVLTPPKYARFLVENMPGARLAIIEGGGHMVALECPAPFREAVAGFMERVAAGG